MTVNKEESNSVCTIAEKTRNLQDEAAYSASTCNNVLQSMQKKARDKGTESAFANGILLQAGQASRECQEESLIASEAVYFGHETVRDDRHLIFVHHRTTSSSERKRNRILPLQLCFEPKRPSLKCDERVLISALYTTQRVYRVAIRLEKYKKGNYKRRRFVSLVTKQLTRKAWQKTPVKSPTKILNRMEEDCKEG